MNPDKGDMRRKSETRIVWGTMIAIVLIAVGLGVVQIILAS